MKKLMRKVRYLNNTLGVIDMVKTIVCPVCGYPEAECQAQYDPMTVFYMCPICGRYEFTETEVMHQSLDMKKIGPFLYYKGFRKRNDVPVEYRYYTTLSKEKCDEYVEEFKNGNNVHGHPVHMDNDIINSWYPRSFAEKVNMILLKLDEIADFIGQEIHLSKYELYELMFVERYKSDGKTELTEEDMNRQAFFFFNYLIEAACIKGSPSISGNQAGPITITPEGYKRIDQLQRNTGEGRNVLVAMKFGDDTKNLREAIKLGIRDAGYNPILIDEVEHNELITPELLSHIKNSKFVVVDLTHQNNGAYFEEGYAMGLGKPVIQLCQSGTKLHFDIAQKNTIIWETEADIPLRLKNRIRATID